jgi:glutamine amidotransferase
VHDGAWHVERSTETAHACERFARLPAAARLVIAHVRQKTVGPRALVNTHPFRRGRFVFAHNGTVDVSTLRIAPEHLAAIEGETDSERLFAFLLTEIDAAGDVARGIAAAVRVLHALPSPGSANFLLSCGTRLYVHRLGRSMFRLDRPGVSIVASEALTDDRWTELPERSLIELEPGSPTALAA